MSIISKIGKEIVKEALFTGGAFVASGLGYLLEPAIQSVREKSMKKIFPSFLGVIKHSSFNNHILGMFYYEDGCKDYTFVGVDNRYKYVTEKVSKDGDPVILYDYGKKQIASVEVISSEKANLFNFGKRYRKYSLNIQGSRIGEVEATKGARGPELRFKTFFWNSTIWLKEMPLQLLGEFEIKPLDQAKIVNAFQISFSKQERELSIVLLFIAFNEAKVFLDV